MTKGMLKLIWKINKIIIMKFKMKMMKKLMKMIKINQQQMMIMIITNNNNKIKVKNLMNKFRKKKINKKLPLPNLKNQQKNL